MHEEQQDFNWKVLRHLQNFASSENNVGKIDIEAGMSRIKEQNKFLVLADSFRRDVSLCYTKELLAKDSKDKRRICGATKEGNIRKHEHLN